MFATHGLVPAWLTSLRCYGFSSWCASVEVVVRDLLDL
jgi:hypothetical protein